jgi:hypothetical protein
MGDVMARALARVELGETAHAIADEKLRARPLRQFGILTQADGEHVGDRALLDHETALHVRFA